MNQDYHQNHLKKEAQLYFMHKAVAAGFTREQANFMWLYLTNTESLKKVINIVKEVQKMDEFA